MFGLAIIQNNEIIINGRELLAIKKTAKMIAKRIVKCKFCGLMLRIDWRRLKRNVNQQTCV